MSYRTNLFMILGKLQRAHPTLRGHFAPAYLAGSNMLRAYLFFIYGVDNCMYDYICVCVWASKRASFADFVRAKCLCVCVLNVCVRARCLSRTKVEFMRYGLIFATRHTTTDIKRGRGGERERER